MESRTSESRHETEAGRKDLFRAIFLVLLAVIAVRSFFVEPFKIPSSSMVPTLYIGDRIFVSKFNYGFSVPFSKLQIVSWGGPKRGDVIVFLFPRDEGLHYIKRVVGVPGDKIEFRGHKEILINGQAVVQEKVLEPLLLEQLKKESASGGEYYWEVLGKHKHLVRYTRQDNYELLRRPALTVPEGNYFVMGDNRDDSYDSRAWGFVPRENIKGRAQMIWLSLEQEGTWTGFNKIRWSRAGAFIE